MEEKELWDLTKDSRHVKFYQWMWGVYAPDKYKTACPYYWTFGFSILILPLIVLAKVLKVALAPIANYFDSIADKNKIARIKAMVLRAEKATTDLELYKICKTKCFINYGYDILFKDVYVKIINGYRNHEEVLKAKKLDRQSKIDKFKYGKVGTALTYIIGAIILGLIGWGIYVLLNLFTWSEFKNFSLFISLFLVGTGIGFLCILGLKYLYDSYICNSWVGKLRPISWFTYPFRMGWTFILMFFDMIKSIYTKSCPTINWK